MSDTLNRFDSLDKPAATYPSTLLAYADHLENVAWGKSSFAEYAPNRYERTTDTARPSEIQASDDV